MKSFEVISHILYCQTSSANNKSGILHIDLAWWKTIFDGRQPFMEDHLWWKTTYDGRRPFREDDLLLKTTFDGRWHLNKDDLWQKTGFDVRWTLMEDDLWWKTTFNGRWPLTEDNLWQKTTFDRRQPLMEDDLWRKAAFDGRLPFWNIAFDGEEPSEWENTATELEASLNWSLTLKTKSCLNFYGNMSKHQRDNTQFTHFHGHVENPPLF